MLYSACEYMESLRISLLYNQVSLFSYSDENIDTRFKYTKKIQKVVCSRAQYNIINIYIYF